MKLPYSAIIVLCIWFLAPVKLDAQTADSGLSFPPVIFNQGVSVLSNGNRDTLQFIAKILKLNPGIVVQVTGNADKPMLAFERIWSCSEYLISLGVDSSRLIPHSYSLGLMNHSTDTLFYSKLSTSQKIRFKLSVVFSVLNFSYKPEAKKE